MNISLLVLRLLPYSGLAIASIGRTLRLFDLLSLFLLFKKGNLYYCLRHPFIIFLLLFSVLSFILSGNTGFEYNRLFYIFRFVQLFLLYIFLTYQIEPGVLASFVFAYLRNLLLFVFILILLSLAGFDLFTALNSYDLVPDPQDLAQSIAFFIIYINLSTVFPSSYIQPLPIKKIIIYNIISLFTMSSLVGFSPKTYFFFTLLSLLAFLANQFRFCISKVQFLLPLLTTLLSFFLLIFLITNHSSYQLSTSEDNLNSKTMQRLQGVSAVLSDVKYIAPQSNTVDNIPQLLKCLEDNPLEANSSYDISFSRKFLRYTCQFEYIKSNYLWPIGAGIGSYPQASSESLLLKSIIEYGPVLLIFIFYRILVSCGPPLLIPLVLLSIFNDLWYTQCSITVVILMSYSSRFRSTRSTSSYTKGKFRSNQS